MIAIRGAVRVARNDRESIYHDTQRLLREIVERNGLERERVVSAFFTMTPDLTADFPAYAARSMGWTAVAMLGAQETPVPGAMDRMVRVLLHADAPGPARHVYLGEAAAMRPDLADEAVEETRPRRTGAEFGPLLVCGLGLVGGSIAMALARGGRFAEILGQDPDPRALERARSVGAVSDAAPTPEEFLDRVETVVLAMPVEGILAWLRERGPNLARGTVVLDVGSTKMAIATAMEGLPEGVEAIGTHPMAGSERSGIGAARPDLFYDATWALVETVRTGSRSREVATAVVEAAGARALFVEAAEHDRAVAVTSHLPYLLAGALALEAVEDSHQSIRLPLAGPGLRDMTRLAATDPAVMAGILATNRRHVLTALDAYRERLKRWVERLAGPLAAAEEEIARENRLPEALVRALAAGRAARETLLRPSP